jgi:hypothetical protein
MKEVIAILTAGCIIQQTRVVVVGAGEFLDNKKHPPLGTCEFTSLVVSCAGSDIFDKFVFDVCDWPGNKEGFPS